MSMNSMDSTKLQIHVSFVINSLMTNFLDSVLYLQKKRILFHVAQENKGGQSKPLNIDDLDGQRAKVCFTYHRQRRM